MQIQNDKVVSIHYTLTNDHGEVLDTSDGGEPLAFLHGAGNIIKGLEAALESKEAGDSFKVLIKPEDGYGEHRPELIQHVPLDALKGIENLQKGMRLQAQTEQGPIPVVVTEVGEDKATLDANHELAGKNLHFDVKVEAVRDATEEEISHGHVHA